MTSLGLPVVKDDQRTRWIPLHLTPYPGIWSWWSYYKGSPHKFWKFHLSLVRTEGGGLRWLTITSCRPFLKFRSSTLKLSLCVQTEKVQTLSIQPYQEDQRIWVGNSNKYACVYISLAQGGILSVEFLSHVSFWGWLHTSPWTKTNLSLCRKIL